MRSSPGIGPIVILVGLVVLPVALAVTLEDSTYDTWGAYLWAPVLLALAYPLCRWVAKRTQEPALLGFFFAAAVLKIVVGAVTSHYVNETFYQGSSDANRYDKAASLLVGPLRKGIFENLGEISGTRFTEVLTGVVQAIIGETRIGTFLVFSFFGFIGLCLLYVAFCEALPDADRTLYRRLLFLTPTMWFWPSMIGKDAFLLMCIGAASLGVVRLFAGRLSGLVLGGLGIWGTIVVRPHVALVVLAGLVFAAFPETHSPSDGGEAKRRRPLAALVLPLLALALIPVVASSAEKFFDIQDLNLDTASEERDDVRTKTGRGGSEFASPDTETFPGMVVGIATVIGRPLPWEASSGTSVLAAVETAALLGILTVAVMHRRMALVRSLRRRWPRFALGYVLTFAWGFSVVSNFGILVRQRSLMLPFLFVLVASARRPDRPGRGTDSTAEARSPAGLTTAAVSDA